MYELLTGSSLSDLSLVWVVVLFVSGAAAIAIAGTALTHRADQLADRSGLGEALVGAVVLGAVTSLAGVVATLVAAGQGHPSLAVGNAIGGIAVQTLFLAVADLAYRPANLEHAAASIGNLFNAGLLLALLILLLLVISSPAVTVAGAHPGSILVLVGYGIGLTAARRAQERPMWRPRDTELTVLDEPDDSSLDASLWRIGATLAGCGLVVAAAGWLVSETGGQIADRTALGESFVGGLFMAVATSLPELVVSVQAVRAGALTMAVANIVGGNSFEVLVVAGADFVYRDGSLLHASTSDHGFVVALTALLMAVLLLGMLARQRRGPGGVGWEGLLIVVLFAVGYWVLFLMSR